MNALARFALNMPAHCEICGGGEHRYPEPEDVKPDEERLDEEDEDGC